MVQGVTNPDKRRVGTSLFLSCLSGLLCCVSSVYSGPRELWGAVSSLGCRCAPLHTPVLLASAVFQLALSRVASVFSNSLLPRWHNAAWYRDPQPSTRAWHEHRGSGQ